MSAFFNPISKGNAPDPFLTYDNKTGYYYALFTIGNRLELFRSKKACNVVEEKDSIVLIEVDKEKGTHGIIGCIWAPEMHKAPNGKWYIYTSGQLLDSEFHTGGEKRLFIMESETDDPFDGFHFKCFPSIDEFSIDPSVYTDKNGKQYICYSRVVFREKSIDQVLEMCELENPYTFTKNKGVIAVAEYDWEKIAPYDINVIVEGAFFVEQNGRLFIIYSANGCWSDDYCLGLLEFKGGDMCDAKNWEKYPRPIFTKGNGAFGPGHASFFRSPDGSELWCAYHSLIKSNPSNQPTDRYFCIQKMELDEDGMLKEQCTVGFNKEISDPAGE